MFPMIHASLQVGKEIENGAFKLYQLHAIRPAIWILSTTVYQILISLIPLSINLVSILIFDSFMFFGDGSNTVENVLWFVLQSFYSIPTGILLAVLYKRGKPAAMTCFFLIMFVFIMQML